MLHTEIINCLIARRGLRSYLEIGVGDGRNFRAIDCDVKAGVDPSRSSAATHKVTSDEFFASNVARWDLVFIDGLHHADQVMRDVENALASLGDDGAIVCHDMNPTTERMQVLPRMAKEWTGDCWKAWVRLRARPGLDMQVIDTDFGCGVITRGEGQVLCVDEPLTFARLEANRAEWLNLVTVDDWLLSLERGWLPLAEARARQSEPMPIVTCDGIWRRVRSTVRPRTRLRARLREFEWHVRWWQYRRARDRMINSLPFSVTESPPTRASDGRWL
jgi:hypothetical protein